MPTHSEASRLNLEYYRKQAKALLKHALSGDSPSIERITRHTPRADAQSLKLHDAQLAVARGEGFPSWPRFREFIVKSGLDYQKLAAEFIDAAVSDYRRAVDMLAAHPQVADAGFYAALVLGKCDVIEQTLADRPQLVKGPSGPQKCDPLLYICFSRFGARKSDHAADLIEAARILLRHGADPNAAYIPEDMPDNPLSCLYGATGVLNNPALAEVLLDAGANPNDGESPYHSTEHPDLDCLRLLLRRGADPSSTNLLKHMLDRDDLAGVRLLLDAGSDVHEVNPRGETPLHWAVWRGRSAAIIGAIADAGADLDSRRKDWRTAYALAVQSGQTETAALLEARGANTDIRSIDRFIGACETAGVAEVERLAVEIGPEVLEQASPRLLPDLAMEHHTAAVRGLLAAGMPPDARNDTGATALHWACWKGYADLVDVLLRAGAPTTVEDYEFHGTPGGWFAHGLHNCGEGDYVAVARLLVAAGVKIPDRDVPTGNAEVDAVLANESSASTTRPQTP